MLDKKMALVVAALMLSSATMVLGASNLIVNGSGILATEQGAPPEVELLYNEHTGGPKILVITVANSYSFNGVINAITDTDGSTYVDFLVTDSITKSQYQAKASKTDINTWTLEISNKETHVVNGHLQITT